MLVFSLFNPFKELWEWCKWQKFWWSWYFPMSFKDQVRDLYLPPLFQVCEYNPFYREVP